VNKELKADMVVVMLIKDLKHCSFSVGEGDTG
jgi:hypothetical protein